MKWFYRWLGRKIAHSNDENMTMAESVPVAKSRVGRHYEDTGVIHFTVYGANGGKIVETTRYDDRKGGEQIQRYVVGEDADFSESLSRIVTMEYLR